MIYVLASIMKRCWPTLGELIATLANLSDGCFPSLFKKTIVAPFVKKRGLDAENSVNYRPISNLNTYEDDDMTKTLASSLVDSRFDCANATRQQSISLDFK